MPVSEETLRLHRGLRLTIGGAVDQETRLLVRAWARAWDEVAREWERALADITRTLDAGQTVTAVQVRRSRAATRAAAATREQIGRLTAAADVTIAGALEDVVAATRRMEPRLIASQLPSTAGTTAELARRFARPSNPEPFEAVVGRTSQRVTSLLRPLSDEATDAMLRSLVGGVASGANPREAARRMLRQVEGRFAGGLTRALTIARTEMLDAHRDAGRVIHGANSDVLAGWTWVAELDTATCPSCLAQHGQTFGLDEPGPLDHQNGRCDRLPQSKTWRQLGFDIDEPPSLLPDAQDWFGGLSEPEQLDIMGPGRLDALQSGRTSWADLSQRRSTDGWRDSFVPAPVKELAA